MWEPSWMAGMERIDKELAWANLVLFAIAAALVAYGVTMMIIERRIL